MTVQNVLPGASAELRALNSRFFLPGTGDFASTLNLGQIIKGKVLRHYDGNRYLVNFGGQERVVDSAVPLTKGELIHGRVIGLGEQVEVQRVFPAGEAANAKLTETSLTDPFASFSRHERLVEQQSTQYRAELSAADKAVLARAARVAGDPNAMALVGVMVNKLGLRQSPDLLWPAYRALLRENAPSAALFRGQQAPQLEATTGANANLQAAAVRQLAETLLRQMEPGGERKENQPTNTAANSTVEPREASALGLIGPKSVRNDLQEGNGGDPRWLAHRLLNAQTGGAVVHRLGTVPLLLGDQLVEIDMAFFEQRQDKAAASETKHRKVVFSLKTEHLGLVEIMAHISGGHVRLHIATDSEESTAEVSAHVNELRAALGSGGPWQVDEVVYETREADSYNGVVRSVVEHVVRQDSLSRLV